MEVSLANFYVVIGAERVNLKLDDSDTDLKVSSCLCLWVGVTRQDKTMLYLESYTVLCTSTFYPRCVCVCLWGDGGAHSVLGLGQI